MDKIPEHRRRIPNAREEHPNRKAWIYVIQCGEFVKVGMTTDVQARFNQLQNVIPYNLRLVMRRAVPHWGRLEFEKIVHASIAQHAHRGEWFRLTPDEAKQAVNTARAEMMRRERAYERHWATIRARHVQSESFEAEA